MCFRVKVEGLGFEDYTTGFRGPAPNSEQSVAAEHFRYVVCQARVYRSGFRVTTAGFRAPPFNADQRHDL